MGPLPVSSSLADQLAVLYDGCTGIGALFGSVVVVAARAVLCSTMLPMPTTATTRILVSLTISTAMIASVPAVSSMAEPFAHPTALVTTTTTATEAVAGDGGGKGAAWEASAKVVLVWVAALDIETAVVR